MSRDYSRVSTSIWNSKKFEKLSDKGKLLYLYYLTNPSVNSIGCFIMKKGYALSDLDWCAEEYHVAMDEVSGAELIKTDPEENLIRIVNFLKFEPFTNVKHAAGAIKLALSLPDCVEKAELLKNIQDIGKFIKKASNYEEFDRAIDRLCIGYRTETETETETETKPLRGNYELPDRKSIDENWNALMDGLEGLVPKSRLNPLEAKTEFYHSHKSREPKMLIAAVVNYYSSPEVAGAEDRFKPSLPRVIKEKLFEPFIGLPMPNKPLSYAEQRMAYHKRDMEHSA